MNSTIAIGNFDGVHLGHQAVINKAKKKFQLIKKISLASSLLNLILNRILVGKNNF